MNQQIETTVETTLLGIVAMGTVQLLKMYTKIQGLLAVVIVLLCAVLFSVAYAYGQEMIGSGPQMVAAALRGVVAGLTASGLHSAAREVQKVGEGANRTTDSGDSGAPNAH